MPVLPTYSATPPSGAISGGRRATGEDFYAGGIDGKGLQNLASTLLENQQHDESRQALVKSSEIRAKYARALDEASQTGGDLPKLKEQMLADLAKVGETFQTKQGAEALRLYTANSELMYDEQANRIEVQRAASQARVQGASFLNSASAVIQSNPTYLPEAMKNAEALVATFPKLSPEKRTEITDGLKKELNMAAAIASARINPEQTKVELESGKWDLTSEQRNIAINRATTEIQSNRANQAYIRAEEERAMRERDDQARDKYFKGIMGGDRGVRGQIMNDADLRPATREHLITFMEVRAREIMGREKKSDPTVTRDLWLRIHAPDSDPTKIFNGDAIFQAVNEGKINTTDANQLNALVANQKDENNRTIGSKLAGQMQVVGRAFSQDPQYIGRPTLVAEIQMDYQARVLDKVAEYRRDKKNPNDLFDPANKDWVGSRAFIQGSVDATTARAKASQPQATKVNTKEEYDALEPGTPYIDSAGNHGIKKGAAKKPTSARDVGEVPGGPIRFPIKTSGGQ